MDLFISNQNLLLLYLTVTCCSCVTILPFLAPAGTSAPVGWNIQRGKPVHFRSMFSKMVLTLFLQGFLLEPQKKDFPQNTLADLQGHFSLAHGLV